MTAYIESVQRNDDASAVVVVRIGGRFRCFTVSFRSEPFPLLEAPDSFWQLAAGYPQLSSTTLRLLLGSIRELPALLDGNHTEEQRARSDYQLSGETLGNVSEWLFSQGDTTIFPRPFEFAAIRGAKESVVREAIRPETQARMPQDSRIAQCFKADGKSLRLATQLDPLDSLLYNSRFMEFGDSLEKGRISRDVVHSFRFDYAGSRVWSKSTSHQTFVDAAISHAQDADTELMLEVDIQNFYASIERRQIEQILIDFGVRPKLAAAISRSVEGMPLTGLPVGPLASTGVAEVILNVVDRTLAAKRIAYVRFHDDIVIPCSGVAAAVESIGVLTTALQMLGLVLNPQKTRLTPKAEFIERHERTRSWLKLVEAETRDAEYAGAVPSMERLVSVESVLEKSIDADQPSVWLLANAVNALPAERLVEGLGAILAGLPKFQAAARTIARRIVNVTFGVQGYQSKLRDALSGTVANYGLNQLVPIAASWLVWISHFGAARTVGTRFSFPISNDPLVLREQLMAGATSPQSSERWVHRAQVLTEKIGSQHVDDRWSLLLDDVLRNSSVEIAYSGPRS